MVLRFNVLAFLHGGARIVVYVVNIVEIAGVPGCCSTGEEARADLGIMGMVVVVVVMIVAMLMAMVLENGAGVWIEGSGGGSEHGGVPGRVTGTVMHMLETLLTTRIGEAVTRSRLIAIAFGVLDEGQNALLNLEH